MSRNKSTKTLQPISNQNQIMPVMKNQDIMSLKDIADFCDQPQLQIDTQFENDIQFFDVQNQPLTSHWPEQGQGNPMTYKEIIDNELKKQSYQIERDIEFDQHIQKVQT